MYTITNIYLPSGTFIKMGEKEAKCVQVNGKYWKQYKNVALRLRYI